MSLKLRKLPKKGWKKKPKLETAASEEENIEAEAEAEEEAEPEVEAEEIH